MLVAETTKYPALKKKAMLVSVMEAQLIVPGL